MKIFKNPSIYVSGLLGKNLGFYGKSKRREAILGTKFPCHKQNGDGSLSHIIHIRGTAETTPQV